MKILGKFDPAFDVYAALMAFRWIDLARSGRSLPDCFSARRTPSRS